VKMPGRFFGLKDSGVCELRVYLFCEYESTIEGIGVFGL
jgi:hypothetical protein